MIMRLRPTNLALALLLMQASAASAQYTVAEITAARARLRLAAERVTLSVELSEPYHSAKAEYDEALNQWRDAKREAMAYVHSTPRYQALQDRLVDLLEKKAPPAAALEVRSQLSQMERDQLQMSGYQMVRERYRRAVALMNDMEKQKRLAVISSGDWQQAWEILQDSKIRYAEFQSAMERYYAQYYGRTYVCWF